MFKKILPFLLLLAAPVFAAQPTLTVYTYDAFAADWGPGPSIKKAFEAQCDCRLKFVALADGVTLLNRLRMEGKKSQADIVLGLDNNLIQSAEKTGLFTASDVDLTQLTVPGGWHNQTFIPFDYGYFAFIYDKNKLKNPPTSLKDLVESPHQWRIIYQDPRTSTPGLGLLLWMHSVFGADTPQAWQKLATKTVTVTKGWSEAYGLFLKGEGDMVLSYSTSPAYHIMEEKKENYAAAHFNEGHYLQVEVAARLINSPHPELAQQFIAFMISQPFQQAIPSGNWMYPVIPVTLPTAFNALAVPTISHQYSPQEIEEQRNQWIREWQHDVSQ